MSALWKAMLDAQKEIKHAIKDSKNPHLKNTYASLSSVLDTVKPILNAHGLVLSQKVSGGPSCVIVHTQVVHAESGEETIDALPVPVKHKFKDGVDLGPDAQELGSAITYGRRYGLLAMCAIASEDDDGEAAVGRPEKDVGQQAPSKPADPAKAAEVEKKLGAALGFKKLS